MKNISRQLDRFTATVATVPLVPIMLLLVTACQLTRMSTGNTTDEGQLEFVIWCDKIVYEIGENVDCYYRLTNRGAEDLYVNGFLVPSLSEAGITPLTINVLNATGTEDTLACDIDSRSLPDEHFEVLKPGESTESSFPDLLACFLATKDRPGDYAIKAVYNNNRDGPLSDMNAWKGRLEAEAKITIVDER
jgi:hypothetical protein